MKPPMNMLVDRRTVSTASTSSLPVSSTGDAAFFMYFGNAFRCKKRRFDVHITHTLRRSSREKKKLFFFLNKEEHIHLTNPMKSEKPRMKMFLDEFRSTNWRLDRPVHGNTDVTFGECMQANHVKRN